MDEIIKYYSTGYEGIDYLLGGGFQPGSLNIIASRAGMGKSALAQNIALNMWTNGCHAMYLSLETTNDYLCDRFVRIALGKFGGVAEMPIQDKEAVGFLSASSEIINAGDIMNLIRSGDWDANQDVIFVDYIQLIEETENLMGIKVLSSIAKETGLTFVLCSQVSRRVEKRKDKRPRPSDIRYPSGYLNFIDTALMLYRDRYYDPSASETASEISVFKSDGETLQLAGTVSADFIGEYCVFKEANA